MTPGPIRLILDHTAITAYAAGDVSVGELVREITEEGARFAVPSICLLQATAGLNAAGRAVVAVLLAHGRCARLETPPGWADVAAVVARLGSLPHAVAVMWADEFGGWVVTADEAGYGPYADLCISL